MVCCRCSARRSITGLQRQRPVNGAASPIYRAGLRSPDINVRAVKLIALLCILLLLVGCQQSAPATAFTLNAAFPDAGAIPGWTPTGDGDTYDGDTLFDLVDGQADAYFAYNFEHVAVQRYADGDNVVRVEIWQLATPADAYGLFTRSRSGEPTDAGNEGDTDPGRRLAFWQDRYVVQIRGRQSLSDETLLAFANAIASSLPTGGDVPALVKQLPQEGLVAHSEVFFRQELSIQDEIWLGGENILGLTDETEGVLARYDLDGDSVYLLVVQYPDAEAASAGFAALNDGDVVDLALSDINSTNLGAVFGQAEPEAVRQLLDAAVK